MATHLDASVGFFCQASNLNHVMTHYRIGWPGQLIVTASEGIRAIATDQRALFVDTGAELGLLDTWEIQIISTRRGEFTLGVELVDWQQHNHTQMIARTTADGNAHLFNANDPERPGRLIIHASRVYLPSLI